MLASNRNPDNLFINRHFIDAFTYMADEWTAMIIQSPKLQGPPRVANTDIGEKGITQV